ncbi:Polyadenylate-binding protein (RRM superfamily) [Pseudoloma neurophilia]|uniref:Polyadenylate-binding protein (RRM superfamily) n=1 Tax=Pseudoloma neurophilia TaxID=146866 RepID=A0A0R0M0W1_9MICR|nr:Polyadenylate-binding protein (RRM superfamily) [Pseudoloma neurophilia]
MVRVDERHKGEKSVTVGLITFLTNEMAEKAVSSQLKLKNQLITVTWAKSLPKRNFGPVYSKTRVHISGIGKLTDDELSNLLGKCSLIYPKKSDPENAYVFAQFETEKEKQTAIDSLNGKKIDEHNTLKLSPAYQSKPRRKRVANE